MLNETAIFDALRNVQEPELGRDIVTLNMVKDVAISDANVSLKIELTTPACPLKDEIERNVHNALAEHWCAGRDHHLGCDGPARPTGAGAAAATGGQEHHRRRLGQGWRGQEHRVSQPGRRAGHGRRFGGPARRRHHWPQHPAHDRRRGRAGGQRGGQDHAPRALRRQDHLASSSSCPRASPSSGAGRSWAAPSSSSCATSTGASSTTS